MRRLGQHIVFFFFAYFVFLISSLSQDIHFSQFYQTPLLINPALTGAFNGDQRAFINYKDQWRSIGTPYKTGLASFDMPLLKQKWEKSYLGAGLVVFNDRAGDANLSLTQVNLSVSSILSLNEDNKISLGLQGGFAQRSIDNSKLVWDNQVQNGIFDPSLNSGEKNLEAYTYGDFSVGMAWNYVTEESNLAANNELKVNLGAAFFHINSPKQKFYSDELDKIYGKLLIHGGAFIGLGNSNLAVLPSAFYARQRATQEINAGAMFRFRVKEESRITGIFKETAVLLGGYYRVNDAIIPTFMVEYANFTLGITYDVNVSKLTAASNTRGGIEISLRYTNPNPFKAASSVKFL